MKFTVQKSAFLKILTRTAGVAEKKSTMAILSNVLISADKKQGIRIAATDLGVGIVGPCAAVEVLKEGSVTVAGKAFLEVIKAMPEDVISVTVQEENFRINVKCGRTEFKIIGTNPGDYPKLPNPEDHRANFFDIDMPILADMIDKTLFAVSTDETRFHLNGIFFTQEAGKLRLVSTDGHRLSIIEREVADADTFKGGVIVPRKGLVEAKKLLVGEGSIKMALQGSNVYLRTKDDVTLSVKLIDAQYPDYAQVVPKSSAKEVTVHRELLSQALTRISLLSSDKSYGVKLSLTKNLLKVSSDNQDFGEGVEDIEVVYDGSDMAIGFNAYYLLEVLKATKALEVKLLFNDEISPGVIRPIDDEMYTNVVMPMRI